VKRILASLLEEEKEKLKKSVVWMRIMIQKNEEGEGEEEEEEEDDKLSIENNENICLKFQTFLLGFVSLGFGALFHLFSIVNVYVYVYVCESFLCLNSNSE
jgi:hypothetical protein